MEKTPHVLLAGAGANKFATEQGVPRLPPGSLVSPYAKLALEKFKKHGEHSTEVEIVRLPTLSEMVRALIQFLIESW